VSIDWRGAKVDGVYPSLMPDLFLARPLVLFGRVARPSNQTITLRGQSAAGPVTLPLRVDFDRSAVDPATLAALWARARMEALMDRLYNKADDETTKQEITDLAINHRLMSPFTSFVAVEERVVPSAEGGPPKTVVVPVPLPEGWDYEAVFGERRERGGGVIVNSSLIYKSMAQRGVAGGVVGGVTADSAKSVAAQPPLPVPPSSGSGASIGYGAGMSRTREPLISLATKEDRIQAVARYLVRQQRVDGL